MIKRFITLSLQSGVIYMVFYGLTISIQDLGLKNTTENGIFLGVTQTIGYFLSLPFAHKMKRKTWSIIFQLICLSGGIGLAYLSKYCQRTELVRFLETVLSTCVIATVNSAQFPILYSYVSEIYPTKIRGLANAMILFFGKLFGALAPFMENISLNLGFHVLVGCSALLVVSIPMSFTIKETLGDKKKNVSSCGSSEKKSDLSEAVEDEYVLMKKINN